MGRFLYPDYNSQSYYVSRSYAAGSNPVGDFFYNAQVALGIIKPPPPPTEPDLYTKDQLQKVSAGINKQKMQKDHPNLKSGEAYHPFGTSKGDPNTGSVTVRSKNPVSGCENCNAGDTWCELSKLFGCELPSGVDRSWQQILPFLIAGGVGIATIFIIILVKR